MVELKNISLPESFYDEEVRSGYIVSKEQKKLWAVELDILAEFIRICDMYNLEWWCDGGTLLGAVRHNGFVPWDFDIDVMMKREDFLKFYQIKDSIQKGFTYSCCYDEEPKTKFGELYRDGTTLISKNIIYRHTRKNKGIHIDIFPFDSCPDDDKKTEEIYNDIKHKTPFTEYLISKIKDIKSTKFCNFTQYFHNGVIKELKDFEKTYKMNFENLTVNIPSGYDNLLTILYGYWKTPYDDGRINNKYFDTDLDYTYYIDNNIRDFNFNTLPLKNTNNKDVCKESSELYNNIEILLGVTHFATKTTLNDLINYNGFGQDSKYIEMMVDLDKYNYIKEKLNIIHPNIICIENDNKLEIVYKDEIHLYGGKVILYPYKEETFERPIYLPFENFKVPVHRDYIFDKKNVS